ncbi:MAG: sigma-70 family RNA polymerase sigma factor, partial [Bacteroidota bacterium]
MRSRNDELSILARKTGTQPLSAHRAARSGEAEVTDEELVERFRDGEKESFDELVRRHQKRIYLLARRIVGNHDDADDVVQDVFVKVYHGLRKFRGESSFATWLYRITT